MNSSVNAHRYSQNKFNVDAGSYEYAIDMHIYDQQYKCRSGNSIKLKCYVSKDEYHSKKYANSVN